MLSWFPNFQQLNSNRASHRNNFQHSEASLASFLHQGALTWPSFWLVHCMLIFWLQLGLFSKLKANVDQLHHTMISFIQTDAWKIDSCSPVAQRVPGGGMGREQKQGLEMFEAGSPRSLPLCYHPQQTHLWSSPGLMQGFQYEPIILSVFFLLLKATFYLHKAWKCLLSTQMHRITLRFVCLSIFI